MLLAESQLLAEIGLDQVARRVRPAVQMK